MITEKQQGKKRLQLHEIVTSIDVLDTREAKVELIRKYSKKYPSFTDYLRGLFDEKITWLVPEGKPPYTPSSEAHPSSWDRQHMSLKYFVKGTGYDEMNQVKRETLWINILESIHPEDSVLVADMPDRRHKSSLTKELVAEALPNLIRK